jgi:hypothetical protein
MADETFETNLLRTISAQLYFLNGMTAAREMFGKSYFPLGISEKIAVDQAVVAAVAANYQALTPETLKVQITPQKAGFQPTSKEKKPRTH